MNFPSRHVSPLSSSSNILVRLQECRGLPLLRFLCGFHSRAVLATCPSGLLRVWPIHPHVHFFISSSIGRCPVCLHSSSFRIRLGHQICRMPRKHLLTNTCNFCFSSLVSHIKNQVLSCERLKIKAIKIEGDLPSLEGTDRNRIRDRRN